MSNDNINHNKVKKIISFSYSQFRKKENNSISKNQVITDIVAKVKEELKEDGN